MICRSLQVVTARRRVLIDWDYAASGIWTILSPEELHAPARPGRWEAGRPSTPRPRADRLPETLLDALEAWNRDGESLGRAAPATDAQWTAFWERAADLAEQVQDQLGPDYEVLHQRVDGAWQWVHPPWERPA